MEKKTIANDKNITNAHLYLSLWLFYLKKLYIASGSVYLKCVLKVLKKTKINYQNMCTNHSDSNN